MQEIEEALRSFRNLVDKLSKPGVTNQILAQARGLQADKRARGVPMERLAMALELCVRMKALMDSRLIRMILERSESSGLDIRSITLSQARLECFDIAIGWAKDPPTELRLEYESWAKNAVVQCDMPLLIIRDEEEGFVLHNPEKRISQLKVEQFFEIVANLARNEQTRTGGGF